MTTSPSDSPASSIAAEYAVLKADSEQPSTGAGPHDPYHVLAAEFTETFERPGASHGESLVYVTGEQVISRLNRTLGFEGWSFRVLEHGMHVEADEAWVLGELRVLGGDVQDPIVRQQFGSQRIKRSRRDGAPLDIGFDLKAATTDCLKKCATLIGVGLYLTRKEERAADVTTAATDRPEPAPAVFNCAECAAVLKGVRLKDGSIWTPAMLAEHTRAKHGRVLCSAHLKAVERSTAASSNGARG
jgi:hypothetical protein